VHDSDELLFVCFYGLMMGLWTGTIKSFTDIIQMAFGPTTNILVGGGVLGVFQRIMEKLDAKAGKLVLRTVTQDDINTVVQADPALSLDHQTLDYEQFERFARETLKHIALDRGKRLGLFMIGGMLVVHMTKNAVKRIPLLGAPLGAFINVIVPTTLVGPAVGVAGAMYL
jgi:hypothetical protein